MLAVLNQREHRTMFFKKKISVEEYCQKNLAPLLSNEHEETWEAIRRHCNDNGLNQLDAELYYSHLRAIFIELLLIAIAKNCRGNASLNAHIFISAYLKDHGRSDIGEMMHEYSQAFASSMTDGVEAMMRYFAKINCIQLQQRTVEQLLAEFYAVLEVYYNDFKSIKLVNEDIKVY